MAVAKKTRGRIWENQETLLLLQKWGDENIQMKLISCTRKTMMPFTAIFLSFCSLCTGKSGLKELSTMSMKSPPGRTTRVRLFPVWRGSWRCQPLLWGWTLGSGDIKLWLSLRKAFIRWSYWRPGEPPTPSGVWAPRGNFGIIWL